MIDIEEIHKVKKHFKELYSGVRAEQETDQTYRDDTFPVEEIRIPHKIWRSGIGARMVDAPAEQIVTSNPQAFVEVIKGSQESGARIAKEFNQWIGIIRRQNPNPFKESVKNKGARGENYIKVVHNESWVTGEKKRKGLPVHFLILDPMVIWGSPEEDENGIPERVIVFYERQFEDIIVKYPGWTNPKRVGPEEKKKVEWLEYWDAEYRYFEADGEPVLKDGIQTNLYGFVPFVRKYSGFGRRSPDGNLKHLIVSDIRLSRDLIRQECITRSNIASIEHIFAHRPKTIISRGDLNKDQLDELDWGSYKLNVLTNVPEGTDFIKEDYPGVPPEMYMNLANIRAEIAQRNPFILAGSVLGVSGRETDLRAMAAMRRYDTIVENTEMEFATALEMALKICKVIPTLKPDGLRKTDLDTIIKCEVKLKAKDEIAEDRQITLGDRLWARGEGSISLKRFHTEFQGMTADESDDEITQMLIDKLTIYNPDVAAVMGMVFGEESGMERWLQEAIQRRQMMETQQKGLQQAPPATTMERIQGETQTPAGREMGVEPIRGARTPPERYTRGGA